MTDTTDPLDEMIRTKLEQFSRMAATTPEEIAARDKAKALRDSYHAEELFRKAGVPDRHYDCDLKPHSEWDAKFAKAMELVSAGATLALVGTRGSGKTQLAVECCRAFTRKHSSALFTTAMAFFLEIKSTYRKDSTRDEREVLKAFAAPHLLVIDEIGKRGESDWENNLLFELLNRRYNAVKPTILIDNRTKDEFTAWIGPSLASRIAHGGGVIECTWESFR